MKKLKILSLVLILMLGVMCFSACDFGLGRTMSFRIKSDDNNMAPALQAGDFVKIKEKDEYVVGDIIAYTEDGSLKVGRIVYSFEENGKDWFAVRGDNNQNLDGTPSNGQWEDDAAIMSNRLGNNATRQEIVNEFRVAVLYVCEDQIEGYVYDVVRAEE